MEQNNVLFKEKQPVDVIEEENIMIHEEADYILLSKEASSDQTEDYSTTNEEMDIEKGQS